MTITNEVYPCRFMNINVMHAKKNLKPW
jgi:hypothetical protein